jgi:hypothetical protein
LIKRGVSHTLINNPNVPEALKKNGSNRREIKDINKLCAMLKARFTSNFKMVTLEHLTFKEQVSHFYNADIIIAAHGAGLSNMFFCRPQTKIIEVFCNKKWYFFPIISTMLDLDHSICENKIHKIYEQVIKLS